MTIVYLIVETATFSLGLWKRTKGFASTEFDNRNGSEELSYEEITYFYSQDTDIGLGIRDHPPRSWVIAS